MAELLQGWKRTHYCAEPTVDEVGKEMVLMGWAGTWRNLGSLIFIGLRDRTGTMQVTFNESELPKEVFEKAETIRSEYVIAVKGVLARRDEKMVNRNMKTGELELIAKELKMSEAKIYGVATFYENFSLEPKGKFVIKICDGTACHVRKSVPILEEFRKTLGVTQEKPTSDDMLFTVETVSCLGACGLAPVCTVNDHVHPSMTPEKARELIKQLKEEAANEN